MSLHSKVMLSKFCICVFLSYFSSTFSFLSGTQKSNIDWRIHSNISPDESKKLVEFDELHFWEVFNDPYSDLLNMGSPLNDKSALAVRTESTIAPSSNAEEPRSLLGWKKSTRTETGLSDKSKKWEHWDAFMEAELGDIDADVSVGVDQWVQEMRDLVEQKRGLNLENIYIYIIYINISQASLFGQNVRIKRFRRR